MTANQFATAWVLANRFVSSVICGPRTPAQFADYIAALGRTLTPDPMEPVEGR